MATYNLYKPGFVRLVALQLLSYRCIVTINALWVGLQCVIMVFHTHLLFNTKTGPCFESDLAGNHFGFNRSAH